MPENQWSNHTANFYACLASNAGCPDMFVFDTERPEQNGCHSADNIFKCIFMNISISIESLLKFVSLWWLVMEQVISLYLVPEPMIT